MSINAQHAARAVETAGAIFEYLSCGMDVPVNLLADAEEYGLSVEAIKERVEELYGDEDEAYY
ncbi:hypothetical protein POP72_032 [Pectobacterium phage POP72]|uniref:Uncharacterized protein n=2 Tax=Axomammavirus PP1 TaxID=2733578 RepID=I7FNT8_9CAUD|nr:hypothetical protein F486_gp27 [Pectobacterium phage PP1]AFP33690.1 hypothetical protein PP1_027 [Pectobacterium phage PP1]ARB10948.1 hypothetical protein POP72_032 [Pectobacterium phage POP72]